MSQLAALKSAKTLAGLARLLDTETSGLAYVLYKVPEAQKYIEFAIPKRYGGTRKISAPNPALRLLQQRLSNVLQNCLEEIEDDGSRKHDVSHGFKRKRSIMSNGEVHRRQRYVFNVDLKDFFPSINFGRVRGFFIKDTNFALDPKVATFLAQIACYKGALPQGSPCSPIISNLIGHVLDVHLARLASKEGCRYTRYADDLTFSTGKAVFPNGIAVLDDALQHHWMPGMAFVKFVAKALFPNSIAAQDEPPQHRWMPGTALVTLIEKSGFTINPLKTRMQYSHSRQEVTGLIVNRKVNVRSDYRRTVRAMTHRLFTKGNFEFVRNVVTADGIKTQIKAPGDPRKLHGMLAFIDQVDLYNVNQVAKGLSDFQKLAEKPRLASKESVYQRFLLFNQFYAAAKPVVLCEGSTDNVYLVHAIRALVNDLPTLATKRANGEIDLNIRLYRYFKRRKRENPTEYAQDISSTGRILGLKGGSGDLFNFAKLYRSQVDKFTAPGAFQPVILLVDNDSGAKEMFGYIKGFKKCLDPKTASFIHLFRNLYVVPTPLTPGMPESTTIEDFFCDNIKKKLIEGKPFKADKKHEDHTCYGKVIFAHKVIKPDAENIDFSNFKQILLNISSVIDEHRKTHPSSAKLS